MNIFSFFFKIPKAFDPTDQLASLDNCFDFYIIFFYFNYDL